MLLSTLYVGHAKVLAIQQGGTKPSSPTAWAMGSLQLIHHQHLGYTLHKTLACEQAQTQMLEPKCNSSYGTEQSMYMFLKELVCTSEPRFSNS